MSRSLAEAISDLGGVDNTSAAERHIAADATVVYADHGISRGMEIGIEDAKLANRPIEYRELKEAAKARHPPPRAAVGPRSRGNCTM